MPDQADNAPPEFLDLVSVDKIVHEPARLAILTALSACASARNALAAVPPAGTKTGTSQFRRRFFQALRRGAGDRARPNGSSSRPPHPRLGLNTTSLECTTRGFQNGG
jgi:hypothetical protein